MDERPIETAAQSGRTRNLPGNRIKEVFRWKEGRGSELVKVGEVDLQKEIDEASRGMSAGEQIARILRGDYSGIQPGDGVTGDLTGYADKTSGEVLHETIKPMQNATATAMANNMTLTELEQKLTDIQNEINAQKKAEEAKQKEEAKENA